MASEDAEEDIAGGERWKRKTEVGHLEERACWRRGGPAIETAEPSAGGEAGRDGELEVDSF